jgi:hypothetical protein
MAGAINTKITIPSHTKLEWHSHENRVYADFRWMPMLNRLQASHPAEIDIPQRDPSHSCMIELRTDKICITEVGVLQVRITKGAQDQASAMLLQIGHDITNNDIIALISDGLAAIGNQKVLITLRTLGLAIGTKTALVANIINNSAQALSSLVLELLSPPSDDLFVTAQR